MCGYEADTDLQIGQAGECGEMPWVWEDGDPLHGCQKDRCGVRGGVGADTEGLNPCLPFSFLSLILLAFVE